MTMEPTAEQDKVRLGRLATTVAAMAGDEWLMTAEAGAMHLVSRRSDGSRVELCTFSAAIQNDELELIVGALDSALLLFRVRGRAASEFRKMRDAQAQGMSLRPGDFSANAAMTLNEPRFWRFLESKLPGELIANKFQADARFKKLLGIQSKTVLNEDVFAQQAWIDLRAEYDAWLRGGQG